MPIRTFLLSLLLISLPLVATAEEQTSEPPSEKNNEGILLTVNDIPVSEILYRLYHSQKKLAAANSEEELKKQQLALMNEIINIILLSEEAKKGGLDQLETVKTAIELSQRKLLAQAIISRELNKDKISESEIRDFYQQQIASMKPPTEYKARHILVKTEKQAKEIIQKLQSGEKFIDLAKKYSTDFSRAQGGDLGWFKLTDMDPAFASALVRLKPGEYNHKPVKSNFGWHIILQEGKREEPVPDLAAVKNKIAALIRKQHLSRFVDKLREKASIQVIKQK